MTQIGTGRVEYHVISSKFVGDKELSVYLPPGYDDSQLAYPVLYVSHGSGTRLQKKNRYFFGGFSVYVTSFVPIQDIADELIAEGKIHPTIIIGPAIDGKVAIGNVWSEYFFQEVIPFVEKNYRVLPGRKHRGLLGFSKGGSDVPLLAFQRPDLFSVVGIAAGGTSFSYETATENYDDVNYPLYFWIWHGRNDPLVPFQASERFVSFLEQKGWEHTFVATNAAHSDFMAKPILSGALEHLSKRLSENR
jgi:enterochelin esterase-like enzyme